MSIKITAEAIDASVLSGPDRNGLLGVVKEVHLIVTALNSETGISSSTVMSVPLKWARPSSFSSIDEVTPDILTKWAMDRINGNMLGDDALKNSYDKMCKELAAKTWRPEQKTQSLYGFSGDKGAI